MTRIALVVNRNLAPAVEAVEAISIWGSSHGCELFDVGSRTEADALGRPDLIVALGGDGTILRAVHYFEESLAPVLGIKFGRLGFLSGAHGEDAVEAVAYAVSPDAFKERRALLDVKICTEGKESAQTFLALNEVVVGRTYGARVVATSLDINGHNLYTLRGDGLIVSTATGSTAYALSAGGPVVSPGYDGMVVVPLASHTLIGRAIVTAPSDTVTVTLPETGRSAVSIAIDGYDVTEGLGSISSIEVNISRQNVELIKRDNRLFYDTVASEFFGSDA